MRHSALPHGQIGVAGWGEHGPMVPNSSTGNTRQNRRVEIYIRPSTGAGCGSFASVPTGGIDAQIDTPAAGAARSSISQPARGFFLATRASVCLSPVPTPGFFVPRA